MHPVRSVLLAASENRWMRENATRLPVFRKAVKRFMPGAMGRGTPILKRTSHVEIVVADEEGR